MDTSNMRPRLVSGLQNIGNTCYMNSVLQCLIHNPILQKYFISQEFVNEIVDNLREKLTKQNKDATDKNLLESEFRNTMSYEFYQLLDDVSKYDNVQPCDFKKNIGSKNSIFAGMGQNDCHELINFFIDTLHEETKYSVSVKCVPPEYQFVEDIRRKFAAKINSLSVLDDKLLCVMEYNNFEATHPREVAIYNGVASWSKYIEHNCSVISQHFTGVYHSTITCGNCGNNSNSFEIFTSVSLEIFPDKEILNNEHITLYNCLEKFIEPEDLIGDNKYNCSKCNCYTNSRKKLSFWYMPDMLIVHLKRFKNNGTHIRKITSLIEYPMELDMYDYISEYNKKKAQYKLISVIQHFGQCNGGHYISYSITSDGKWYRFDDGHVSVIEQNIEDEIVTNASYILIYSSR